jgi:acyl-coenzyme A synthetase/AMP-(fatty) acid ligase
MSRLTEELERRDLPEGSIVAGLGGNSATAWLLMKSTNELGLNFSPINDSWSPSYIQEVFAVLRPAAVIGYGARVERSRHRALFDMIIDEKDSSLHVSKGGDLRFRATVSQPGLRNCLIFCTSGSSGPPKCVVAASENVVFCRDTIGKVLGLRSDQTIVSVIPPSFDYGFYQGLFAQQFGSAIKFVKSIEMLGDLLASISFTRSIAAREI